jgi:hypothetical protein
MVTLCMFPDRQTNKQTDKQQRKTKQTNTHTQETTLTKEKSPGTKHKWKRAVCDHLKKFFRHMKIKISYTL